MSRLVINKYFMRYCVIALFLVTPIVFLIIGGLSKQNRDDIERMVENNWLPVTKASARLPDKRNLWEKASSYSRSGNTNSAKNLLSDYRKSTGKTLIEILRELSRDGTIKGEVLKEFVKVALFLSDDPKERLEIALAFLTSAEMDGLTSAIFRGSNDPKFLPFLESAYSLLPSGEARKTVVSHIFLSSISLGDISYITSSINKLDPEELLIIYGEVRAIGNDVSDDILIDICSNLLLMSDESIYAQFTGALISNFSRRGYSVGEIIEKLKDQNMANNTILNSIAYLTKSIDDREIVVDLLDTLDIKESNGAYRAMGSALSGAESLSDAISFARAIPTSDGGYYIQGHINQNYSSDKLNEAILLVGQMDLSPNERDVIFQNIASGIPFREMEDRLRIASLIDDQRWKEKYINKLNSGSQSRLGP